MRPVVIASDQERAQYVADAFGLTDPWLFAADDNPDNFEGICVNKVIIEGEIPRQFFQVIARTAKMCRDAQIHWVTLEPYSADAWRKRYDT